MRLSDIIAVFKLYFKSVRFSYFILTIHAISCTIYGLQPLLITALFEFKKAPIPWDFYMVIYVQF